MALQDLTPQLRTRLSRMERAVGWFVILATALLLGSFFYYIYNTAQRKGWFITKIHYQTSISSGAELKVGDPVKLMGFDVGEITRIQANDPGAYYNITVDFLIRKPYYGYLWTDSSVRVVSGSLLGDRYLEVTKGYGGVPTVLENEDKEALGILIRERFLERRSEFSATHTNEANLLQALNTDKSQHTDYYYTNLSGAPYWLEPQESPAVSERVEKLLDQVESALPGIFALTNQLTAVLSNSITLTANFSEAAIAARPAISNLALITARLNDRGAFGEWLLPTNIHARLDSALGHADETLITANTNIAVLAENLNRSLISLSEITSNLNAQVQMNTNILAEISRAVVNANELVQGLKRHWLLRSAFRKPEEDTSRREPVEPLRSPRDRNTR